MRKNKGSIFIVSAPSGAGKTTLCKAVLSKLENIVLSVSYTTRIPRKGEVEGVDYSFISIDKFKEMISDGEFIEWAEVHGNFYGTSARRLEDLIIKGYDVLLDIDTQGAKQIKSRYGDGVYIFIMPPSIEVLRERIEKRQSNTKDDIERRLKRAIDEIKDYNIYDYVIVNDKLERAINEFESIIVSERVRREKIDPHWIEEEFINRRFD